MAIAEYSGETGLLDKPLDKLGRTAGLRPREISPVEADRHARDFPMPGRRILAFGLFAGASIIQRRAAASLQSGRLPPGRQLARGGQAEFDKIGNVQGPLPRIAVRLSRSTGFRNVADGVCTFVAVG